MKTPTAYEWHNLKTGHCYVDYIRHPDLEFDGEYTKTPLYKIEQKESKGSAAEILVKHHGDVAHGVGWVFHNIIAAMEEYRQQPQKVEQEEIIKALSGEKIEDVKTVTSTEYPVEQKERECAEEIPSEVVSKMQHEFMPNLDSVFKEGMYSGYAFGLQDGFKYAQSRQPEISDEEIDIYFPLNHSLSNTDEDKYMDNIRSINRRIGAKEMRDHPEQFKK
jgi:hypothetical protein